MNRVRTALTSSILVAVAMAILIPSSALAATVVPGPAVGNDVSFPQCGTPLPATRAFAVVGVNGGLANNTNPCFAGQFSWAQASTGVSMQPKAALYVNTANPALAGSWWPKSNVTRQGTAVSNPYGTCAGLPGAACAYVYGYSTAFDDANGRGVSSPASYLWWLDVELINTWQLNDKPANTAVLEGMTRYFQLIGAKVGLYSTPYQWDQIAGQTKSTSNLARLDSWLAGANSESAARTFCTLAGLTPGGRVTMAQYVLTYLEQSLDYNLACGGFTATPVPLVSGAPTVGQTLTVATGSWQPSPVQFAYQWRRNGAAISGANGVSYPTTSSDLGAAITVTVTGRESGYTTVSMTSGAKTIGKPLTATPVPTLSGYVATGHTISAVAGTWQPGPVTLAYQWYRNGVAVPGATTSSYAILTADAGTSLRVVVTGSKTGYTAVARASVTTVVPLRLAATPTPSISGTARVGSSLRSVTGSWLPTPVALKYQWRRDRVPLAGATSATYTATAGDALHSVTVTVTGSRTGYLSVTKTSAGVTVSR